MLNYTALFTQLKHTKSKDTWLPQLPEQIQQKLSLQQCGDLETWLAAIEQLPNIQPSIINLDNDIIIIGAAKDSTPEILANLRQQLMQLHPWRKGPFNLFGLHIDTEWRSDLKWHRIAPHLGSLKGEMILDVGSSNGYYGWRMIGLGAECVIGIDPSVRYIMQWQAIRKYLGDKGCYLLPFSLEDLPENLNCFDRVFSMGVLYHRRSPIDHLLQLKNKLKPGGQLILETLVIDGKEKLLIPPDRYAQMRNVWFIPSCDLLIRWLQRCGYKNIECIDISTTTIEEQRSTDWMTFQSLKDFLDPQNPQLTIEGLPAPKRAIIVAHTPT